jgi:hypothetical protein
VPFITIVAFDEAVILFPIERLPPTYIEFPPVIVIAPTPPQANEPPVVQVSAKVQVTGEPAPIGEIVNEFGHDFPFDVSVEFAFIVNPPDPLIPIPDESVTFPDTVSPFDMVIVFVYPVKSMLFATLAVKLTVQFGDEALKTTIWPSLAVGTDPRDQFPLVPQSLDTHPVNILFAILSKFLI